MTHETTVESVTGPSARRIHRWTCTCGEHGDWRRQKRRAVDGGGYHSYATRPMTASEVLTMGDSMFGDLTQAEAQERADATNEREGWT